MATVGDEKETDHSQDLQAENRRLRALLDELIQGKRPPPVQVWFRVSWMIDGTVYADPPVKALATAVRGARGRAMGGQNHSSGRGADAWVERAVLEWEKVEGMEFMGVLHGDTASKAGSSEEPE